MQKYSMLTLVLILILLFSVNVQASSDLDVDFFIKLFNVEKDQIDYFAKFDISNDNLSTILYFYSNADRTLTKDQFRYLRQRSYNWRELSIYFGLPPIMFEDKPLKLRRPKRERMQVPFGKKRYSNRRKTNNIEEKVELNPGKYEYYYKNKARDIEEKIEVKQNKYEYYYKSNQMEEKLEVHMKTYKYEYHFEDFLTGREIKKEGRGQYIEPDKLYRELQEKYDKSVKSEEPENKVNFNIKIKFNF